MKALVCCYDAATRSDGCFEVQAIVNGIFNRAGNLERCASHVFGIERLDRRPSEFGDSFVNLRQDKLAPLGAPPKRVGRFDQPKRRRGERPAVKELRGAGRSLVPL